VTTDDNGEWHDDAPYGVRNLPFHRDHGEHQSDHASEDDERANEGNSEAHEDLRHFKEEVGSFHFLLGGTPSDVIGDQVCEDSLTEMNRQATEEDEATPLSAADETTRNLLTRMESKRRSQ
jgi:hypothetical protein